LVFLIPSLGFGQEKEGHPSRARHRCLSRVFRVIVSRVKQ
jgi:hypothetical protein